MTLELPAKPRGSTDAPLPRAWDAPAPARRRAGRLEHWLDGGASVDAGESLALEQWLEQELQGPPPSSSPNAAPPVPTPGPGAMPAARAPAAIVPDPLRAAPSPGEVPAPSSEPAPSSVPAEIPLELYARIKAALWARHEPLEQVLGRFNVDETVWRQSELARRAHINRSARQGDCAPARELRDAMRMARDALTSAGEHLPLDRYASLRIALEASDEPEAVLAAHDLDAERFAEARAAWARRARADRSVARDLRRAMAAARKAQRAEVAARESGARALQCAT